MEDQQTIQTSTEDENKEQISNNKSKKKCRVCMSFKDWMRQQGATVPDTKTSVIINEEKLADCPPDVEVLGRATWTLLHTMAANYPESATSQEQAEMHGFLKVFAKRYPCIHCAEDFREWMRRDENRAMVGGREDLSLWMCQAHNEVNKKLGKPIFDCTKWKERWRDGWRDGHCG